MTDQEIADSLSEAQREAFRGNFWRGLHFITEVKPLIGAGVLKFVFNPRSSDVELTPLGLRVRSILEKQNG